MRPNEVGWQVKNRIRGRKGQTCRKAGAQSHKFRTDGWVAALTESDEMLFGGESLKSILC